MIAAIIPEKVEIRLLGTPFVSVDGRPVAVPEDSRGLLLHLALRSAGDVRRPLSRAQLAVVLWPDSDSEHAAASLRTALWRLRSAGVSAIESGPSGLRLEDGVGVDLDAVLRLADRIAAHGSARFDGVGGFDIDLDFVSAATDALDLLPGCYDEWVDDERRRTRSSVLAAFDVLCAERCAAGRSAEAIDLALTSISIDPLRERSQAALIAAHLAEHNVSEARRTFAAYRRTLLAELGVEPSPGLAALLDVAAVTAGQGARITRLDPGTAPARAPLRPSPRTPGTETRRARPGGAS